MRPVLFLKPGKEGEQLCQQLRETLKDCFVYCWPAFSFEPPQNPLFVAQTLKNKAQEGFTIFIVSPTAARMIHQFLKIWPANTQFAAVGETTANIIKQLWPGNFSVFYPPGGTEQSGSERLYQCYEEQGLPKLFLIARGQTGREFLYEKLSSKGVHVEKLIVYQRIPLRIPHSVVAPLLQQPSPIIYLTSKDSVDVLLDNLGNEGGNWAKEGVVLTIHPRIIAYLKEKGFQNILLQKKELSLFDQIKGLAGNG